ncbi:MAG: ABC transporter permease subunit [Candidatus Aminicenantes bacterium]|uniref:ABC-type transport system involved in multi-copper enzyme maturation, permease component n=1 Tax=Candidatus Saccharicenans subterraneus TaxID=2508984 RepID=A0A3E2BJ93_9BACT|nr:ABC transporter permease subunit [Candidatus Aminicenantes bacterium]RFT14819.1 MAG: ABC-type transport system involved in multi-copper enzyme maturation, permease component [Candidatus Saccharicenans subterraneum]
MSAVWSISKKELVSYFTSPIAYIVIAIFILLSGFFFYSLVWWFNTQAMQMAQNPYYFQQVNINQMVFAPLFHNLSIILLLMLPVVSMRLFSEEKKMGTEELLFTSPVSVIQIILGKYLAALVVLLAMLVLSAIPTIFTFIHGNPEPVPYLLGYLGLFLLGAAFLALGLFWSALTENQIVSAVLTFGTLLLFWVLSWAAYSARGLWQDVLNYLSFFEHFDGMTKGILDTSDLVYYLSFAFFGLFLTHSVIQFRRWR